MEGGSRRKALWPASRSRVRGVGVTFLCLLSSPVLRYCILEAACPEPPRRRQVGECDPEGLGSRLPFKKKVLSWAPVTHACNPSYSEIRRIEVQSQPRQIVGETLSQKNPSQKRAGQVVEHLPSKSEPLSPNPNTTKNK
jgi:hypothetical protein